MQYRAFGNTGWDVSEVGIGTWQMGGTWGEVDDDASVDTLLYAFDRGINFIDTAAAYGAGRSERVVGRAVKAYRGSSPLYIATKVTPPPGAYDGKHPPGPDADFAPCFPEAHLRASVDESLARLQCERLDLLQLHVWLPTGCTQLGWLEVLNDLRLQGKIDKVGVSLRDVRADEGVGLARLGLVSSIQVLFNLFEQRPLEALLPAAQASRTAAIARVPFDSGALTGTWTADTYASWAQDDKRHQMYRGERFRETLERAEALKQLAGSYGLTLPEAAVRYCLHPRSVSTVIPGMRNREEVDLNLAYSDGASLPEDLLNQLDRHHWHHEFYQ